jgi:hypothetical protein
MAAGNPRHTVNLVNFRRAQIQQGAVGVTVDAADKPPAVSAKIGEDWARGPNRKIGPGAVYAHRAPLVTRREGTCLFPDTTRKRGKPRRTTGYLGDSRAMKAERGMQPAFRIFR